ncbi:MAG: penicillin-insensitive murein endopeptidase [Thermoleophilaceae bacterium]|nr:penicillin-insensitive murein endopeptidase [Thermoleophilaceae bacterium]
MRSSRAIPLVLALLAVGVTATAIALPAGGGGPTRPSRPAAAAPRTAGPPPAPERTAPGPPPARRPVTSPERIRWRRSVAVGDPAAGRLLRGVRLPSSGEHFFTWDPVKRRSPNRYWRRWGTDRLVRLLLRVAREYHTAHPGAPRMAIGDLSRPGGGDFGPQFGYIGHATHQNGLDADVYYPRADGLERAPRYASQINRRLSQELVDRFVAAGAVIVYVGPNTGLRGPPGVVQAIVNHDNHLHVRIR